MWVKEKEKKEEASSLELGELKEFLKNVSVQPFHFTSRIISALPCVTLKLMANLGLMHLMSETSPL